MPYADPAVRAAYRREYYARNRDKVLEQKRQYYAEHRTEILAKEKARYAEGRTPSYREAKQPTLPAGLANSCEICGTSDKLVVDHDHACCAGDWRQACGRCIRGRLCASCNSGLGFFGDDATRLASAITYLSRRA